MKTSVAKKLRDRVLAAFMAIAVMISCVVPSAITASAAVDPSRFSHPKYGTPRQIEGSAYGVEFNGDTVQIRVNGADLKEGDTVNLNTDFDLYLQWQFNDKDLEKQMVGEGFPVAVHCPIPSDQVKNLGLNWHDGPKVDSNSGMTYEYYVDGTDVWIVIWDPGTKEENFAGDMLMSAKLQANKEDADKEGKLNVKFFDKEIEVIVEDFKPSISVEKSAGDITYDETTGKFYVPFTVEVSSPVDATDVKITDTFQHDVGWSFYVGEELHDLKLDGKEISVEADGSIHIGELKADEKKTLTYSIEIDPAKQGSGNDVKAETEDEVKPGNATVTPSYNQPTVNKSGSISEDGKTVSWELKFSPAGLEKLDKDGAGNFVIKDTPDSKLGFTEAQKKALEAKGATFNTDGSITIPESAFEESTDWSGATVYTLKYETEIGEDYRTPLFDTPASNDVEVTFPDNSKLKDVTVTGSGTVTIKGIDESGVEKELLLEENGRLSWQADVHLPHFETIDGLEITDTTGIGNGHQYHKIDRTSVKITYKIGGAEETVNLSDVADIIEDPKNPQNDTFKFSLKKEFIKKLNENNIRDLVITYDTVATSTAWTETGTVDNALTLENRIEFTVTSSEPGSPVTRYDTFIKTPRFGGEKWASSYTAAEMQHIPGYDEGKYALRWAIKLDNSKDTTFFPKAGDVITIVDTLPNGYDITPDSWVLSIGSSYSSDWWGGADNVKVVKKENISDNQIKVTIEITIDDEMAKNLKEQHTEWGDYPRSDWSLILYYETGMTDEAVAKLTEKPTGQVTNKADVLYNGEPAVNGLKGDTWLSFGDDRALDKYTLMENLSKAQTEDKGGEKRELPKLLSDDNGDYIFYKLDINKDGIYLGGLNEDGDPKIPTLTAVDTLGSELTFGGIESGIEADRLTVTSNENGQKLTFTLDNGVPYHIVYKVYINIVPPSESIDPAKADELFNNKVELKGAEEIAFSKQSLLSSNVYHASASITGSSSTTYLEIKGTKLWKNDDKLTRPKSIEITVVQKNKKTGEEIKTTTYTVDSEKGSSSDKFEYTTDGDSWTFTLKKLVAKTSKDVEYCYDVTEVKADGYMTTYDGKNIGISKDTELTITNDASGETIDIPVEKKWDEDGIKKYGVKKDSVTVYLTENGKKTEKSLELNEGNGWKGTFGNLPKNDSNGKEIIYSVEEVAIDGFKSEVKTDASGKITVTNTVDYESFKTSVSGKKTWVDESDKYGKRPTSIKIYLYANKKLAGEKKITGVGDVWTYEFTDLPMYDESGKKIDYTVSEGVEIGSPYSAQQDGKYNFINRLNIAKVKVQKEDEEGNLLAGATLQLWDRFGKLYEWTTDAKNNPYEFSLVPGETYTLKEIKAPKGYDLAEDKVFTAPAFGTATWTMIDKKTPEKPEEKPKASILKVDENDEPLAGAKLAVLCDGKEVTSWTTDGKAKEIELETGKEYILRELDAPKGYEKAADVKFTAPAEGKTVEVKMIDKKQSEEPKPTKVEISKKDITNGKELAGAKLKVVDKDGNVIKEWTSTDKPAYFENVFKAGETYTLVEETAPNGYVVAEEVKFTVNEDGTVTKVEMKDDVTKVQISKKDITGGNELSGAHLVVVDENGNTVAEFDSTDKPTYFEAKFEAGKTYTLREETAPDGYVVAEEVKFTVSTNGDIDIVEMVDDTTKVQISKQDITNGKELAGAKLKVVDKDGNVIKEWTSTNEPTYFENVFKAGETYTLIEETAPDGYVIAEEVKFTVSKDGNIDKVVMKDDVTKVSISKKDITGDGELAGAKLQVLDNDGKVIDSWVSGDKPHEINGVLVAGGMYTLHEEVAPDGYIVANDIEFVVNADGTVTKVTMIDEAKNGTDLDGDNNDKDTGVAQGGGSNDKDKDTGTSDNNSPQTGDSCDVTLAMLALALGIMALANKKRRNN